MSDVSPDHPATGQPNFRTIALIIASAMFMEQLDTLAFDKIPHARMSAATSFYTTFQQLMLSIGICVAALALHGSSAVNGHAVPQFGDFSAAFLIVTAISLTATIWNRRFAPDAGSEISGHRPLSAPSKAIAEGFDRTKSA